MHKKINNIFLILSLLLPSYLFATNSLQRNCMILLDKDDNDNVGRISWFLVSRIQSIVAEQTTPFLINSNLWNSFIERRINFTQDLERKDSPLLKTHTLYQNINERIEYWSNYYNALTTDALNNKKLVVQHINKEFYHDKETISARNYQLLLNYYTHFDLQDWDIYTNNGGFYLFVPKKYSTQHVPVGFKIDSLEKVIDPEDTTYNYFASSTKKSLVDALPDFFMTYSDCTDDTMSYAWNILLAGHGGAKYAEINQNEIITWVGEPIIADLTLQEFTDTCAFFQSRVKTNFFHYATCYGAGNHISLAFKNNQQPYNFAIMCDTLTDCASYCKWTTLLPSQEKKFLTTTDLVYDQTKNCWQLPLAPVYHWGEFFNALESIDFSVGSIERLQKIMGLITHPIVANIPLLCLPNTNNFFPLQSSEIVKIDDQLLACAQAEDDNIVLHAVKTILIESTVITPTIMLNHINPLRILSIKPGDAVHYIKKLESTYYIDLPSVFWQAHYQHFDKTFILDECIFPYSHDLKDILPPQDKVILKNVIISQQKDHYIRIFGMLNDKALMAVAHKHAEENEKAIVQEIVTMTPAAQKKYEAYYVSLKDAALKQSV